VTLLSAADEDVVVGEVALSALRSPQRDLGDRIGGMVGDGNF